MPDAKSDLQRFNDERDQTLADLRSSRERLCRAQTSVPTHWRTEVGQAIHLIDLVGSSVFPDDWSADMQPEYE